MISKGFIKKQGERLYDNVCNLEAEYLRTTALKIVQQSISPILLVDSETALTNTESWAETKEAGERFLTAIRQVWGDQTLCIGMINDVLIYMDRSLTAEKKRRPIYTSGMNIFRDNVLLNKCSTDSTSTSTVLDTLLNTLLFLIHLERHGHAIDRFTIRYVVSMLSKLHDTDDESEATRLYLTHFEPRLIQESQKFYAAEGAQLLETADSITFCRHAQRRLDEEKERCDLALASSTASKIQDVIDDHLIKPNIAAVINMEGSGVKHMLDNDRSDDLNILFKLVVRIDSQRLHLRKAFGLRIISLGDQINATAMEAAKASVATKPKAPGDAKGKKSAADKAQNINLQTVAAIKWVDDILILKAKYDEVWKRAFEEDHLLQTTLTDSFREFINSNSRCSEYLSLFFDENLKKGIKGKTEEEIDLLLDRGIVLLRFINDRDLFEQYYKKHLSRRLLMKRSVSMDAERQIISKMKIEVGTQFTSKLEAMFSDISISADITAAYKSYVAQNGADGDATELDMNVLTSTRWPIEMMTRPDKDSIPIQYPAPIERLRNSFEQFYYNKHSGRKLSWQLNMGTADLRATFVRPNGKLARHELNVSTYAMFILMLFNDIPVTQALSFDEIRTSTGIPENELVRNLQSLAVAPKTRVLRKEPMSREVSSTDRFYYNAEFQSPYMKIKIGVVSGGGNKVENQDQRKETEQKMGLERKVTIEAAIVRIMKQRKRSTHTQLVTEVIQQLSSRFSPDVAMVKSRIEDLLEREYLERIADSDTAAYAYVA
ncbi:Cullin-3 [Ascosphaera pollenicola]|nr:Cullin-3 [Ascosphaera pollenicola]